MSDSTDHKQQEKMTKVRIKLSRDSVRKQLVIERQGTAVNNLAEDQIKSDIVPGAPIADTKVSRTPVFTESRLASDFSGVPTYTVAPQAVPAIQLYEEENDRTVFQEDCPLTLGQLFQVFTLNDSEIEFNFTDREGEDQTVRFTRDWVYSPTGAAVLRGRLRYALSQAIVSQGEALLQTIDGLSGNPERIQELREDYEIARSRHETNPDQARTTGAHLVEEARGRGTSWNDREGGVLHAAWDVSGPRNTGVYVPVAGTVIEVTRAAGYGHRVKILHPHGPDLQGRDRPVYTNFCHLDEVLVAERSEVHPGQAVGLMGNTRFNADGVTTIDGIGTHLHFSVQVAARNIIDDEGNIVWERVNTRLGSQYERNQGIRPQRWFNAVTGSSHPYRTQTSEATSNDQSREVHEFEAQGIPRENLRRRSGRRGEYTYRRADDLGTITPVQRSPIQRQQSGGVIQFVRPSYVVGHTFLGINIPVSRGLHPTMRDRLINVQAELQRQYDALDPVTRPASLQEYAGIDTIKGWRETTSQHGTGSAVDVNYSPQPYIATRTTVGSHTTYGGERPTSSTPQTVSAQIRALRRPATEVYDRAVSFLRDNPYEEETADVGNRRQGESATHAYRRFRRTSDTLRDYLSLVFLQDHEEVNRPPVPNPETASEADLLAGIPADERKDEAAAVADIQALMNDIFWQMLHLDYPLTAREQYIRILRDYEIVRRPMQYGNPVVSATHTRNPARGFLHMPEHFVVAMMDVGHLRWGACEFSAAASGDVHHFDLRDPHHTPAPTPAPATAAAASEEAEPVARKKIGTSSDASQLKSNENRANDTGLPDDLKANIESLSGHSLDDVKVNFESAKPAQLQAHAYAQGSDIHLAPGQEQHLPHEAWHVVQQKEGRVKATSEIDGRSVNDDTALEKEANVMGAKAASHFAHDFSQVSTHTRAEVTEDEQGTRPQQVAQRAFDQAVWAGQYTTPALTSVVQRLHQPIVGRAPASAISIQRFITLVEAEEARYPESEQRNTRLMITRLRKIFYDRQGWDEHLIQGARGVAAPYSTNRRETGRERVEVPGPFNDFEVVRHRHTVRGAGGRTPEIARNQEIALPDGTYIDLGHVFAGLDAANYPQAVSTGIPLVTIGIDSNVDAVTWVGDLGSVVAEIQFQFVNQNFSISESEIQAVINEYASPQDMMGNIDAYVIAGQYNISQTSGGMKVSEMLRQYYLSESRDRGTPAREHRYSLFAQAVGLRGWNGTHFNNEAAWVDRYTDQVNDTAALYVGANTGGSFFSRRAFAVGISMNQNARWVVQLFLIALKQRILAEPQVARSE